MSQELVSIVKGIPTTTSLKVADTFGKRHSDVLRGIADLKSKCPEEFSQRNFASADYTDEQGKPRSMYLLTRDGMTLLVMGYTGKEAMKYKLAYIEAFNAMEAQIKQKTIESSADNSSAVDPALTLSTPTSRKPLATLVSTWAKISGLHPAECWAQVNAYFQVRKISDLTENCIPEAMYYVQYKIDMFQLTQKKMAYDLPDKYKDLNGILLGLTQYISKLRLDKQSFIYGQKIPYATVSAYCAMTYLAESNLHAACSALTVVKECFD